MVDAPRRERHLANSSGESPRALITYHDSQLKLADADNKAGQCLEYSPRAQVGSTRNASRVFRVGEEEWKLSILNDRFIVPVDRGRFDLVSSDFD